MTDERIGNYLKALENEERAAATIEKYRRALLAFAAFLGSREVIPEMIHRWKEHLREQQYAPSSINTFLAALNGFFHFQGGADCRAKFLKIQRRRAPASARAPAPRVIVERNQYSVPREQNHRVGHLP